MPATSQLEWLSSTTAIIVLFWSRATRDLLKSFGWGIAALHRLDAATKLPRPRRPPHSIFQFRDAWPPSSAWAPSFDGEWWLLEPSQQLYKLLRPTTTSSA